ncbi:hypothetical protein L1987_18018 [Smallanthus sonchifolius]|uniref:Uncharacterized protein n=1 Tax=Smallanthus sonchifolius TaxID=185202 RepID=A0ACB9J026_9ASTR|nr:hypothetical protein L1987_18018 [Smallanthus sonchifolius]
MSNQQQNPSPAPTREVSLKGTLSVEGEGKGKQREDNMYAPVEDTPNLLNQLLTMLTPHLKGGKVAGAGNTSNKLDGGPTEKGMEDDLTKPYRPDHLAEQSKFTTRLTEAPLPAKLKMTTCISKYDGNQDPEDHLHIINGAAHVEQWSLPVWCHMFAQTLTGPARVWFNSLPSQSIDNFVQLKEKFLRNFSQQKKRFKNANEIMHIQRKENESIEQYMERFINESLLIEDVPKQMKYGHSSGAKICLTEPGNGIAGSPDRRASKQTTGKQIHPDEWPYPQISTTDARKI